MPPETLAPELLDVIEKHDPTPDQLSEQDRIGFDDGWNNRPAQYDDSESIKIVQAYMTGYRRGQDQSEAYDRLMETDR